MIAERGTIMTAVEKIFKAAKNLDVDERTILAHRIWASVEKEYEERPLSNALKAELERRLDDLKKHPERGSTWEEVKARLQRRRKCSAR